MIPIHNYYILDKVFVFSSQQACPEDFPLNYYNLGTNKSLTLGLFFFFKFARIAYSYSCLFVRNRTKYNLKSCQEPH